MQRPDVPSDDLLLQLLSAATERSNRQDALLEMCFTDATLAVADDIAMRFEFDPGDVIEVPD